jgi:hypothetical protein
MHGGNLKLDTKYLEEFQASKQQKHSLYIAIKKLYDPYLSTYCSSN